MQWEEKLFWISRGFRTTITIEIACAADGVYRAELTEEQEEYACPACASPCRATIICEGVTRRHELATWEQVDRPLWSNVKTILLATPDELVPLRKIRHKTLLSKGRRRLLGLRPLGK